ncbi:MAG: DUF4826 family protein [Alteromonadaceae bacterium]|nr:DUF4826 family protein [Alteromonadaceae bacterium]
MTRHGAADESQKNFAQLLISRAEGLYELSNDNRLWANS